MARGDFPSSKQDQFVLRFPEGLRHRVKVAAEQNNRSMNAEIVARLEETFIDEMFRQDAGASGKLPVKERRQIRELQEKFFEALARENEALKKAGAVNDHIIFQFASAIMKAAEGDRSELEQLVEREKTQPVLKRLVTVSSIVDEKQLPPPAMIAEDEFSALIPGKHKR